MSAILLNAEIAECAKTTDRISVLPLHLFTEGRSEVLLRISVDVRSCSATALMSALPPKADIQSCTWDVRCGPEADILKYVPDPVWRDILAGMTVL